MDVKTGFFYLFSVVLYAGLPVITARNPACRVALILAFSQAAGLWMLLKTSSSIALVLGLWGQ